MVAQRNIQGDFSMLVEYAGGVGFLAQFQYCGRGVWLDSNLAVAVA